VTGKSPDSPVTCSIFGCEYFRQVPCCRHVLLLFQLNKCLNDHVYTATKHKPHQNSHCNSSKSSNCGSCVSGGFYPLAKVRRHQLNVTAGSTQLDWPDWTVGLGPDRTGLILVRSGPKVKDRTVKQSPFLVRTGPDRGQSKSYWISKGVVTS
jgi:hypothetical protein